MKAYKFFILILFLVLSFPFLFFSWGLIQLEYDELIKFGDIERGIIIDEDVVHGSSSHDFGYVHVYDLKIINREKQKNKTYSAQIDLGSSSFRDKIKVKFIGDVKKGDTVNVKILSDNRVKILKWKNLEINKSISYSGKFGRWILIAILLLIAFYLYFRIYKVIIK